MVVRARETTPCIRTVGPICLSCRADGFEGNHTERMMKCSLTDGKETLLVSNSLIAARGMHYFLATDELVFCSGDNDKIQKVTISEPKVLTDVAVGSYYTVRGEITNTYQFGWKPDGTTNQIFRMGPTDRMR